MQIREVFDRKRFVFLDGSMGTQLQVRGLQPGQRPELAALEMPDTLTAIHTDDANAGTDILLANTFGANAKKLAGCGPTVEEVVAASGIEIEDNLFLLNKYSAAQAIFEKLPYVEEVTINRALPDTIVITERECAAAAGVVTPEGIGSSAKTVSSSSRPTRRRPAARASRASSRSRPR